MKSISDISKNDFQYIEKAKQFKEKVSSYLKEHQNVKVPSEFRKYNDAYIEKLTLEHEYLVYLIMTMQDKTTKNVKTLDDTISKLNSVSKNELEILIMHGRFEDYIEAKLLL